MNGPRVNIYFSDFFNVDPDLVKEYGAFNVSLVSDLPLFIDPFLLFNSRKTEYRALHAEMIKYLRFLRDKSVNGSPSPGLLAAWYRFPEVKQNNFGFCLAGNRGRGLGSEFAQALNENLHNIFSDFGSAENKVTKGEHLEKLCLIRENVGKDCISDFTTNLIKGFLLDYTEAFAKRHIARSLRRTFSIDRVRFNYSTESWERQSFDLPVNAGDYVLLTPRDILTKDDIWINKNDLLADFAGICSAIPNDQLRAQIENYFRKILPRRPKEADRREAARKTLLQFKELIDYYIKFKEEHGANAASISEEKVIFSDNLYVRQFGRLAELLAKTGFYDLSGATRAETRKRILFLKDVIENKGGHKIFYNAGRPIARELDLQILFRLTWCGTVSDVNREVDNGRGPADFTVSRGSLDKGLVEMKLASNSGLQRNLEHQVEIYQKASDAQYGYKVIVYFSAAELARVKRILKKLDIENSEWVILIDARDDNKPSGSRATSH